MHIIISCGRLPRSPAARRLGVRVATALQNCGVIESPAGRLHIMRAIAPIVSDPSLRRQSRHGPADLWVIESPAGRLREK